VLSTSFIILSSGSFFIPTNTKPPAPKDDSKNESGKLSSVIATSKFGGRRQKAVLLFVLICL
jgi:hypothetical protein